MSGNVPKSVRLDYTNYRGERKKYDILPLRIWCGSSRYHPEHQWLMDAIVIDGCLDRTFAMNKIHSWTEIG